MRSSSRRSGGCADAPSGADMALSCLPLRGSCRLRWTNGMPRRRWGQWSVGHRRDRRSARPRPRTRPTSSGRAPVRTHARIRPPTMQQRRPKPRPKGARQEGPVSWPKAMPAVGHSQFADNLACLGFSVVREQFAVLLLWSFHPNLERCRSPNHPVDGSAPGALASASHRARRRVFRALPAHRPSRSDQNGTPAPPTGCPPVDRRVPARRGHGPAGSSRPPRCMDARYRCGEILCQLLEGQGRRRLPPPDQDIIPARAAMAREHGARR